MEDETLLAAGYCGLACKSCSIYIASKQGGEALERRARKAGMTAEQMLCRGCRSDKTSPYCTDCRIKACIKEKGLNWCSQCDRYPCADLSAFADSLPHRKEVLRSLDFARDHTPAEWDEQMRKDLTCARCGRYNTVYAAGCPGCGHSSPNAFAERHRDSIADSPECELVK